MSQAGVLQHLLVNGACPASATTITVSSKSGKMFEWSPWQPRQHETAHYSAITWRAKDATERERVGHKESAVCGGKIRVGWYDHNHSAKFCPPGDSRNGNLKALCSFLTTSSWPLVNIGLCTSGEKTFSTL